MVLGCFAGAAAGATWGKDSEYKIELVLGDNNEVSGYVSNETGDDYLYLENGNIADDVNVTSPTGYDLWGFYESDEFEDLVFWSDGEFIYYCDDGSSCPQYINVTDEDFSWNYSYKETVKLFAYYYELSTSISFDINGGSISKPADIDDEMWGTILEYGMTGNVDTDDTSIYIFDSTYVQPTREGYTFAGWTLTKDGDDIIAKFNLEGEDEEGSQIIYLPIIGIGSMDGVFDIKDAAGDEYKWIALKNPSETTVTLYAKWDKIEEQLPTDEQLPTGGGSKNNIIVIGGLGSGDRVKPGIDYMYVTFDTNGGDGEMERQQFAPGYTHALHLNEFTKDGFIFTGWSLEPSGTVYYQDGQEVMLEEDITIYAVWVAEESDSGIPTWLIVLIVVVILAILIALIVYFLVIRRGGA